MGANDFSSRTRTSMVTWTDAEDKDLLLCMLLNSQNGQGQLQDPRDVRVAWDSVVDSMKRMGHFTTKDAVHQRWKKRMLPTMEKRFTSLPSDDSSKTGGNGAAKADADASKPATPKGRKRGRKPKVQDNEGVDDDNLEDPTPTKKAKKKTVAPQTYADEESA